MTQVSVVQRDEAVRVGLSGELDADLGEQLLELTQIALAVAPEVVIDVSDVTAWTPDGLRALMECADLGAQLPADLAGEPGVP